MFLDFLTQTWKNTAWTLIKRPPASFPRPFAPVCCLRVNVCSPPHQLIRTRITGDGAGAGPSVMHPWSAGNSGHWPPPRGSPSLSFPAQRDLADMLPTSCPGGRKCLSHGSWRGGRRFGPIQAFTPIFPIQERLVLPDGEFRHRPDTPETEGGWKNVSVCERILKKMLIFLKENNSKFFELHQKVKGHWCIIRFAFRKTRCRSPLTNTKLCWNFTFLTSREVLESTTEPGCFLGSRTSWFFEMEPSSGDFWAAAAAFYLSRARLILWNCFFFSCWFVMDKKCSFETRTDQQ